MPILNRPFPFINSTLRDESLQIEYRDSSVYTMLGNDWKTHDYWYCEILVGECFCKYDIETFIPADILSKIKTDNHTFLVICNAHEAFNSIVNPIYKELVIKDNIPAEKIILISESADLITTVKNIANQLNEKHVNVMWSTAFQSGVRFNKLKMSKSPNTLESKFYPKKFLNLNRRWRQHRPVTVAFLKMLNLLDHGYVSIDEPNWGSNWEKIYSWMINHYNYDTEILNLIKRHREDIVNIEPMYLDTKDLTTNKAELTNDTDYYYENTLVSLVSETNYYSDSRQGAGRFLSEKTFKPISQRHPFIMITVPRTLQLLRTIGYKTFHPWINEDYDLELNDDIRLKKILKEINRICHLSDDKIEEFLVNVRPIVEHNYNVLMNNKINMRKMK